MKSVVASLLAVGLAQVSWAAPATPAIDVYKSPTCGCCNKWIDHLKANGFAVRSHDTDDVVQHKAVDRRSGHGGEAHADQPAHGGADPVDRLHAERRDQVRTRHRIGGDVVEGGVGEPVTRPPPGHVGADNVAAPRGQRGGKAVEIPAVPRQPMHAEDGRQPPSLAPRGVGEAVEPIRREEADVAPARGHTTPFSRSAAISAAVSPVSASTSSLCAPSTGGEMR